LSAFSINPNTSLGMTSTGATLLIRSSTRGSSPQSAGSRPPGIVCSTLTKISRGRMGTAQVHHPAWTRGGNSSDTSIGANGDQTSPRRFVSRLAARSRRRRRSPLLCPLSPQERRKKRTSLEVRKVPKAAASRCSKRLPELLDHLVGDCEQLVRDRQT